MRKRGLSWEIDHWPEEMASQPHQREIGSLTYSNDVTTPLRVPPASAKYDVQIGNIQVVHGLYLASHRALSAYQKLTSLPSEFSATDQLFKSYYGEVSNRWRGKHSVKTPMMQMKESLIAAAVYGYETPAIEPNSEARQVWEGFQGVLRKVLPTSLGFTEMSVNPPEVVIRTRTGDFLIDAVSGGISSLIEISWQIFLRSRQYDSFTVCMDEPENHLHPQLQRSIIPSLLSAFPRISFVVATHSPFIVTSVHNSHVYVLDYEGDAVKTRLLDSANKAASSDEILRRVLGLETTIPLWVERQVAEILATFKNSNLDWSELRRLRAALLDVGLGQEFPAALDAITLGENNAPTQ